MEEEAQQAFPPYQFHSLGSERPFSSVVVLDKPEANARAKGQERKELQQELAEEELMRRE